jgi:hypothetical protein
MTGAELSLQVVSKRKTNDRSSLRLAMIDPQQVYCEIRMSNAATLRFRAVIR